MLGLVLPTAPAQVNTSYTPSHKSSFFKRFIEA